MKPSLNAFQSLVGLYLWGLPKRFVPKYLVSWRSSERCVRKDSTLSLFSSLFSSFWLVSILIRHFSNADCLQSCQHFPPWFGCALSTVQQVRAVSLSYRSLTPISWANTLSRPSTPWWQALAPSYLVIGQAGSPKEFRLLNSLAPNRVHRSLDGLQLPLAYTPLATHIQWGFNPVCQILIGTYLNPFYVCKYSIVCFWTRPPCHRFLRERCITQNTNPWRKLLLVRHVAIQVKVDVDKPLRRERIC